MRRLACVSLSAAALSATLLLAPSAKAELVEPVAGVKAMAGGSLWSTPSDRPNGDNYEGIGYAGNGGGFSYGAGLYLEARFIKVLSLELDLIYDKSTLMRNVDYGPSVKVQEKIVTTAWRIPVLAKANLPTPFGRLFVLAGPEFVRPSSSDASMEVTEGEQYVAAQSKTQLATALSAKDNNYTMFTGGLGLTIDLLMLEIPLELRASKNLGQDSKYDERVDADFTNVKFNVDNQSSWDFRVSAGVGYAF